MSQHIYRVQHANSSSDARELRNAHSLASDQLLGRCFQRRENMLMSSAVIKKLTSILDGHF